MKNMEESSAVRTYFLKERQTKSYNVDKLIEEQMPVRKLMKKSVPSKQTKPVFHNQYTPTRYERERATMKNKPRKVLNLEERVLAIRLYQEKPVYQRVASIFKCSWEQVRNVIANRDDILRYYGECQTVTHKDTPQYARNKKINFLGNVTYEFVRRAHYHRSVTLNDETLRQRALKLRDILQIEQFHPNKAWLADFKKVYNVEWQNLDALIICGVPPRSLDNKDLIEYCTRMVSKAQSLIGKMPKPLSKKESTQLYHADDAEYESASSGGDVDVGVGVEGSFDDNASDSMYAEQFDDVPVVNEIDDFSGTYLDTPDNDDEGFNGFESEPAGANNNYADTVETATYDLPRTSVSHEPAAPTEITAEPALLAEVQIKQERRSRSRSRSPPLLSPLTVTSGTSTSATTAGGGGSGAGVKRKLSPTTTTPNTATNSVESNGKRLKTDEVTTYAEALRNLCPLEDFATQQEDFQAINLLMQLARVFEKGAKRSAAQRRIHNS
uniref:HTH CENPB-type domain-containing protein n=1 Tax=Bactrocera dorsalis TaxID=27457 RepID=A0A034WJV0_BACDO